MSVLFFLTKSAFVVRILNTKTKSKGVFPQLTLMVQPFKNPPRVREKLVL